MALTTSLVFFLVFFMAALMDNWKQNPANVMYYYDTPDTVSVFRTVC